MTRADSTTSVVARRIIARIRALSPTTLTEAMTLPSRPRIGAPTETMPRWPSSWFCAQPRSATAASSASSRFLSVIVHGVWATGRQSASRRLSSSGGSAASKILPELVQCAGSRCPTWRKTGSRLWLSSRSTYTTSSPSSTATCTISPVSCRSVAITGSAAWCRSTCSVTLLPSSYRTRPRRYRPGVLPRSSSRSAVSVVTSRCTVLLLRPSWRASSVMPSSWPARENARSTRAALRTDASVARPVWSAAGAGSVRGMRVTVALFRSAGQHDWIGRRQRRTVWANPTPGGHVAQILWFENYQPADAPELGGKNASLGTLLGAGLPVPPGFAVSADCYRKALADGGLTGQLDALLAAVDPRDTASVAAAGERARALIGALRMPADLDAAIRGAYARLCEQCGDARLPVAVRSSATCEDQPDASFAGEHDTYLWVRGGDSVVAYVLRCWASLFTDRGIAYRLERGYRQHGAAMRVGVQQMVRPRAAGVAFTLNPLNGDRSQIAIDASWGFGEAVVSGEVTPDNFLVNKVMGAITRRTISAKTLEYRLTAADAVTAVPVEAERQSIPCLSDDEIQAVARLARRAEKHYKCPQDVEWAIVGAQGDVLLLQSRPETVWSRKPRQAATCNADPITSMVQTLLHPSHGTPDGGC